MNTQRIRHLFARTFLVMAYIAVTLQWLWILAIGLPQLVKSGIFDSLMPTTQLEPSSSVSTFEMSPVIAIITGVVTLLFLLLTIVILIKLPKTIAKTGERIVHQSTDAIIPVITHHKKLPPKKKLLLSRRITRIIQLLLVLIPLVTSFFIPSVQTITSQIITTLAIWLAGFSTICFAASWLFESSVTSRTQSHASHE